MEKKADLADILDTVFRLLVSRKPTATAIPSLEEIKDSAPAKSPNVTLALDISGSCIGWAIGCDGDLVLYGKYVFKTTANKGEKLYAFYELLDSLFTAYKPEHIALEKPDPRFGTRNHFEFLGVLRLLWFRLKNKEITDEQLIGARTIKKHMHVDLSSGENKHQENKAKMVKKINTLFGLNLQFDIKTTSSYKNDDDIADAIAVLVTCWRLHGPYGSD